MKRCTAQHFGKFNPDTWAVFAQQAGNRSIKNQHAYGRTGSWDLDQGVHAQIRSIIARLLRGYCAAIARLLRGYCAALVQHRGPREVALFRNESPDQR